MKTDPFDDAIRRKLEGVNPPFQEKNWTQFQRFMGHQGFPPSLWQTPTRWLQPALMAAAVTGVVISTVWQYRTTQSLTNHVQTLTKTVERMEQVQMQLQQSVAAMASAPVRTDTVYLTQSASGELLATAGSNPTLAPGTTYSVAPTRQQFTDNRLRLATDGVVTGRVVTRTGRPTGQQQQSTTLSPVTPGTSGDQLTMNRPTPSGDRTGMRQPQASTDQPLVGTPGATGDRIAAERSTSSGIPTTGRQPRYTTDRSTAVSVPPEASGGSVSGQATQSGTVATNSRSIAQQSTKSTTRLATPNDPTLYATSVTNAASAETAADNPSITASGPLAAVQPLTPLALTDPAGALAESWQRHLRRVRYRSPYTTTLGGTAAAAAPEKNTVPLPITFRVGVGGDLATTQSGVGAYAEAILANRLTIGTGISQIAWVGDEYSSERQFMAQTKRDFRRDYPGSTKPVPLGPGKPHEVMNISRSAQSLVVPIQIGYRFNVARQFVLTPTVGLNLSITPSESASFEYDRPIPFEDVLHNVAVKRPIGWYSNATIGLAAERKWGHFVGQVSPVVLLPVRDPTASLNTLSAGLRGRLFYQF
ncbi:hypothetical protein [Fibrivirga algicola]|uniref:Outer membrane protein beta-barrel domain-containing protein n=1 Tax=Fibrivirga algicola TaxID=2950420 RepID=A0ABX0Q9I1_9BACT|nr:hypothetical protein [Fibrivirga algicola]ARK09090.1 hypothetical protein A6C57_01465 [Fibrella sp. ES10-3-2-2]NID08800.1 hypothetical protein [Fibrivirga algicola]